MMGGRTRRSTDRRSVAPKRATLLVVAAVVVGCSLITLFVVQALEMHALRRDLRDLHAAQQTALFEQARLRERLAKKDDPSAIEDVARERLGWVMRGEEKVVFIGEEEE